MTIRRFLTVAVAAALTALAFSNVPQPAMAAVINWGAAQNITGSSDVVTTGSLFASANFFQNAGAGSGDIAVNGVTFSGFQIPNTSPVSGSTSQTVGNITLTGTSNEPNYVNLQGWGPASLGGPASYNALLSQCGYLYNTTSAPTLEVSISGLTNGYQYSIQYWVNDSRGTAGTRDRTSIVGGQTLDVNVTNLAGGSGQYITGTFTADSSSQSFTVTGGNGGLAYANAMQVRLLAVPEPSAIAILAAAAGMGAMVRLRRSRHEGVVQAAGTAS